MNRPVATGLALLLFACGQTRSPSLVVEGAANSRLDGKGAVNLTPDSPANDAFPSISADGRRIVFRSGRDGPRGETSDDPPADMAIYVMGGDGENPHRLTDSDARETMPAISPDGE